METHYETIKSEDGSTGISFDVCTRKGSCHGLFADRIYVHHISGDKCMKGLMAILVKKFKTNKITFTPLINDNIENHVKGIVKWLDANDSKNPYGEPMKYMECEWITT